MSTECFTQHKRQAEEIQQLCLEMRESKETHATQFEALSYEDGVLATIRWLFFSNAESPYDIKREDLTDVVNNVRKQIFAEELEQIQESRE
jgi:hypothetical protein